MSLIETLLTVFFLATAAALIFYVERISARAGDIASAVRALAAIQSAPASAPKDNDRLRLEACERFTLLMERVAVPNLLLRMPPEPDNTTREYTATLLLAIRQEFEYNTTQQIYVSDALWSIIIQARDNVSLLITRAAEGADTAAQVADRLRHMSSRQPEDAVAMAQHAIRKEASGVLA